MQIDFHHTVTYVIARLAGFKHKEAEIIAYCAQYVDDATNSGSILFDNGAMYSRTSSAHKTFDYRNFKELANHLVWIPFHFLPGNGGKPAGEDPQGTFIQKIKCSPDSFVTADMIKACIAGKDKPYSLHRLGITMHVYADTWAHQGFAGVNHRINKVIELDDQGDVDDDFASRLKNYFGDIFDEARSHFVDKVMPLGHGATLSNPDLPYLKWSYKDLNGNIIKRDNSSDFLTAADRMYIAMKKFISGNFNSETEALSDAEKQSIYHLFKTIVCKNENERHEKWIEKIKEGFFSFGPADLNYIPKGINSWKHIAVGTVEEIDSPSCKFSFDPLFLKSNWKFFHDALLAHRFDIIHNILPEYGICAA